MNTITIKITRTFEQKLAQAELQLKRDIDSVWYDSHNSPRNFKQQIAKRNLHKAIEDVLIQAKIDYWNSLDARKAN